MTTEDREVLAGGMANAGAVVRRGDVVERPASANSAALQGYLGTLREYGFDGAPTPLGMTAGGREELSFVPGEVAVPPYPQWALGDDALRSVGELLRRLHDVSGAVGVDGAGSWAEDLADPLGGTMICHNDVCPENVVFRDGRAVALIDFDLAAPGRAVWDVAMAARYWVPMVDPESAAVSGRAGLDVAARLRVLADGYGLSAADRVGLPEVIEQAAAKGRAFVAGRVAGGDQVFVRALAEHGGWQRWDRLQGWLAAHREEFRSALVGGKGEEGK